MPILSHRGHISSEFNAEMESMRQRVLSMGGLVEQQIRDASKAFTERDTDLAEAVSRRDEAVNAFEVAVDEESCVLLARRQPAAFDLRLVYATIKTSTQLERIGDEAAKIARLTIDLCRSHPGGRSLVHIGNLSRRASELVRRVLDAFARLDAESALAVVRDDADLDDEYEGLLRQCITHMMEDPRKISEVMDVIWTLRSLERIGDHACNIAEYVIFLVKGKDVRHTSLEQMEHEVSR